MNNAVKETIVKTINTHNLIEKGDHVVIGLSGGPDSVCLFSALYELADELGITMEAVHVNHKFRPGAAEEDAEFVQKFCEGFGIECSQYVFDCIAMAKEQGKTVEEVGRDVRYLAFDEVAEKASGPVKIAVAQNADDQCETMLFRLIRGTGPDGLASIAYSRKSDKGIDIVRPLLDVKKKDILEYCEEKNLSPRIDYTNSNTLYTRNRIRLELIPYIEENFNPAFSDSLVRLSRLLNDDKEYMWQQTHSELEKMRKDGGVDCSKLTEQPVSIKSRIVMELAKEAGLYEDVTMTHIDAALYIAEKNETSLKADFPSGYEAVVQYGVLRIRKKGEASLSEGKLMKASFDKQALIDQFGTAEITVRTRKPGDYIRLASGRKKLKELFIDMKIPQEKRDHISLACIGSEVLWAAGVRYSSEYKVKEDTRDVVDVEIFVKA